MRHMQRGWLIATTGAAVAAVAVIGVSTSDRETRPLPNASADSLAPLRQLLDRFARTDAVFDARYSQTALDGTVSEYRIARRGTLARFENTAFGEHIVVLSDGSKGWRCTGAAGQPASRCAPEPVNDFSTRYDPRTAAAMLPKLLAVGSAGVTVERMSDIAVGEAVDCAHFAQPRPGRKLDGRVCVTADGVLAVDEFGSTVRLTSLTRTVDAALFAPPSPTEG